MLLNSLFLSFKCFMIGSELVIINNISCKNFIKKVFYKNNRLYSNHNDFGIASFIVYFNDFYFVRNFVYLYS